MSELRVPELATLEVEGVTRSSFILRGALATGALYGIGAVAPFVERAFGAATQSDVAILSFALALEQLESAFYSAALKGNGLPANAKKVVTEIAGHEAQHVQALTQTVQGLGGNPPPAAKPKVSGNVLKTAAALEELGVSAYNGAAVNIKSGDLLQVAGAIVQVEARHAAAVRQLSGQDPAPNAFDKALTQAQATAAAKAFGGP